MIDKNSARLRRSRQTRLRIRENGAVRLTVRTFGLPSIDADEELFLERIGS